MVLQRSNVALHCRARCAYVDTADPPSTVQVDLLPLKNVGDNLFRLPGRKPAAIRADIAKLGRLESEYVREIDSYRVDERVAYDRSNDADNS